MIKCGNQPNQSQNLILPLVLIGHFGLNDQLFPFCLRNTLAIQSDQHYLFASRMNNLTKSTLESQPSLPDKKAVPPQPNGAPLNADKNRRRAPVRLESYQIWGDSPEIDLFVTLLKILKDQSQGVKLQNLIMNHRDTTKDLLRASLRSFSSKQPNTLYENEYSKKPHLGMGVEQLGFKKGAIINQSAELTSFWRRLITITATELNTNLTTAFKIVRKYVRQSGIFKRLYEQHGGGLTIRPKADQIGALFKVGGKEIDEDSVEFKVLFTQIVAVYFQEINSCIYCLNIFFDPNNVHYQGFRSLFAPANNFSMLEILWNAYVEISTDVLAAKPKDSGRSAIYENLRGEIFTRKIKLLLNLIKLFYSFLTSFEDTPDASKALNITEFHVEVIKQLDKDIIEYQKTSNICGVNVFNFSKFIVELFLLLFPFKQIVQPDKDSKKSDSTSLYNAIRQIQSEPLRLIKVLLADGIQTETNRVELTKKIKEFDEIAKSGEWSAYTIYWKKWLGIFLKKYRSQFKMFQQQLARRIIKLCKTVVAEEYHQFWDQDVAKKHFYLNQIKELLNQAMAIDFQDSTNYALVLPICTKLMGNITKGSRYAEKVIELLNYGGVQSVFNSITFSLKIDQQRNQSQQDRIVYRSRDYDKNLEHQIKFVCKLVELCLGKDLALLEGIFLGIQPEPQRKEAGAMLIIKLLQIFFSISPEAQSDLKCLRYLIKTINALFICAKTRDLLCVALAAVEGGKASYPKDLRAITSRCYDYDRTNQLGRQAEKLRNAISYHLNCILRISDTLEQYFPTTTQREVVHKYRTLQEYLQQQNVDHSYHQMSKIIKTGQSEFKSVSWFYEFAKLLQSSRLTSVDLNSISLFLQKMKIKNKEARQYANLSVIVDILNNGRLQDIIIGTLTPLAKRERNRKQQEKHFLGLANKEIEGFMTRPMGEYLSGEKYFNHAHKLEKQKKQADKEKIELYCKLSGCLTLIETVLKLRLEGDFPLLKKIDFFSSIIESLYGEQPHVYKVKFITKVEKIAEKREFGDLLGKREVEQEMESSVNLLHCIASLWNLQGRLDIDETLHPSYTLSIKGTLCSDFTSFINKVRPDIFMYSQENVLTNFTRTTQSLGIGTVGKILEYTVLLGFGKKLYYSILSRSYPLTRGLINASDKSAVMDEFMGGLLRAASHQAATINEKRQVIELLSVLIQQSGFGEYIRSNIFRFKEAISQGKEFAIRSTSIHLIAQFLLFLNLLLNIDSSELNIRFAKSCLTDPIEFGKKLLDHCVNRLKDPVSPADKNSKYVTFEWSLTLRQGAVCKLALLLYLGVVSYLISNEHSSLAIGLCSLIISKSDVFLKNATFECSEQLDMLLPLELKERQQAPELVKGNTYSSLIIDQYFLNAIFLNNPFSFAENYIEQPWEVMQKSTPKQARKLVLAAHRVNSANALHYACESMAQFYYLLLNSIFQRGHNGLFFLSTERDIPRPPQVMLFRKEKAKNQLSLKLLFGENEGFLTCCFRLCRDIQRQIWENPHEKAPRDIGLTVIRQLLKSVERSIDDEPHHLPDSQRMTDKIATYLKSAASSFNFTILTSALQSLLQLANRLLIIGTAGKKSSSHSALETYFQRIQEGLDTIFSNIQLDSLAKLSQQHLYTFLLFSLYLFDMEINNIQHFQNKLRMQYLEDDSRFPMLEKLQKIFKSTIYLLNNPKSTPQTTALVLQLCNKSLYIDFLSKKSAILRIVRPQSQLLFAKLQKIGEKLSYEDVLVGTYLGKFIMQVSVFAQPEQNRQIMRIVKAGFTGMEHRLKKITEVKSLAEIQQCSNLVGAFASLAMEEQHWRNEEFSGILDKIFLIVQEKPLRFDYQRIVPEEQLQVELNNKHFGSSTRGRSSSIFSFYSSLCMYELARNFLFFLSFSLTSSPTLHQLCNNTFNKGLLQDLSLDRLRESLNNVISFLTRFVSQLFNNDIEEVLNISNFACFDYEFIKQMNLAPLCFERYPSKEDFHSSLAQTITLTNQSIQLLCQTWQRYDWKATSDWRPSKTDLLKQFQKLLQLYRSYFKDYKEQSCERSMRGLEDRIKQDLDGFNF